MQGLNYEPGWMLSTTTTVKIFIEIAEELRKMEAEPLLPVEKKLIVTSLVLGVVLLGFLIWISYRFFPGGR